MGSFAKFRFDGKRVVVVNTPLAQRESWLVGGTDYRSEAGVGPSTPMEQAYPLLFLCSDAASAITGITLVSDAGWFSSGMTGSFPGATAMASFLYNRAPAYQPSRPK